MGGSTGGDGDGAMGAGGLGGWGGSSGPGGSGTGGDDFFCGDGLVTDPEVCDGTDLQNEDCISQGFLSGTLACATDCASFDTSMCTTLPPIETLVGCDATYCATTGLAGPHGGDLCLCVIPAGEHPAADDIGPGSCGPSFGDLGADLLIQFDTTGYVAYSVTTCNTNTGDSSLAAYDADPSGAAVEIGCSGDAAGENNFCSEIVDSGDFGFGGIAPTAASNQLFLQVDEYRPGDYWDNSVDRYIEIELVPPSPNETGLCDDNVDNDADNMTDCGDSDCAAAPACLAVERITGCDPAFCTMTAGSGPNGGDMCSCTLDPQEHPIADDQPGGHCAAFGNGAEVVIMIDTTAYDGFSVSTCNSGAGNSSVAAFDSDPALFGPTIGCDGDAEGQAAGCSEIGDSGAAGPAVPTALLGSNELWIQWDDFDGSYWNGATARTIDIELLVAPPESCLDGIDNDFDGDADCLDSDCSMAAHCQPIEMISDCDPTFCTFAALAGPNGGDLCTCSLLGLQHPSSDDVVGSGASCNAFGDGDDLIINFNVAAYDAYSITTCEITPEDSSIAVFDGDPTGVANELACGSDAVMEPNFCSEITDNGGNGPPLFASLSGITTMWVQVDEFNNGAFWNDVDERVFQVELIAAAPEICNDALDNDLDGDFDCADSDCNASASCSPVETISGCDPTYCSFSLGMGPNGGDLCTCTFDGGQHPTADDVTNSGVACGMSYGNGDDLIISFATAGYTNYSFSSCRLTPDDSSIAVFDGDPLAMGNELVCSSDAANEPAFCSEITDSGDSSSALPTAIGGVGTLYILVDEFADGDFWDGLSQRSFEVELIP